MRCPFCAASKTNQAVLVFYFVFRKIKGTGRKNVFFKMELMK